MPQVRDQPRFGTIKGYGEINYTADSVSPQVQASTLSLSQLRHFTSFAPRTGLVRCRIPSLGPVTLQFFCLSLLVSLVFSFFFFSFFFPFLFSPFLPVNYTCAGSSPCENDVDYLEECLYSVIFSHIQLGLSRLYTKV